jgi:hypothetical protein
LLLISVVSLFSIAGIVRELLEISPTELTHMNDFVQYSISKQCTHLLESMLGYIQFVFERIIAKNQFDTHFVVVILAAVVTATNVYESKLYIIITMLYDSNG